MELASWKKSLKVEVNNSGAGEVFFRGLLMEAGGCGWSLMGQGAKEGRDG